MSALNLEFKSFAHMLQSLPDDNACREHFENVRWNGTPVCPHCAGEKSYKLKVKGEFKGLYKCGDCRRRYTVLIGTIFEGSHVPLLKWYIAIHIFSTHKKGASSRAIAADLGVTQATAWYMLSRIRHACKQEQVEPTTDTASFDETFVGGKNKNRHRDKKVPHSQGRSYKDKTPVFGMIQNGKIFTKVIPDTKRITIGPLVRQLVKSGATIITDEWHGYGGLSHLYDHQIVNHGTKQYMNEQGYSSNNVENFWSHLKRGIIGTYHQVSKRHLQRYCDEFSFRFNTREMQPPERFLTSLKQSEIGRLRYRDLIAA